jgi:hypothetical protein
MSEEEHIYRPKCRNSDNRDQTPLNSSPPDGHCWVAYGARMGPSRGGTLVIRNGWRWYVSHLVNYYNKIMTMHIKGCQLSKIQKNILQSYKNNKIWYSIKFQYVDYFVWIGLIFKLP